MNVVNTKLSPLESPVVSGLAFSPQQSFERMQRGEPVAQNSPMVGQPNYDSTLDENFDFPDEVFSAAEAWELEQATRTKIVTNFSQIYNSYGF